MRLQRARPCGREIERDRDLVAAGELRAAVALVPHLARQRHHVGLDKAEPLEEHRLVGEREDAIEAEPGRLLDARAHEVLTVAAALAGLGDGERLQLGDVGPHDVQRPARDHLAAVADHEEVAQVLVRLALGARQHVAARRPEVDEVRDAVDVPDRGAVNHGAVGERGGEGEVSSHAYRIEPRGTISITPRTRPSLPLLTVELVIDAQPAEPEREVRVKLLLTTQPYEARDAR